MRENKAKIIIFLILVLITFVLQQTLAAEIAVFNIAPNFLLFIVVFSSFYFPSLKAAAIGGSIGLFYDLIQGKYLGLETLSLAAVAFVVSLWSRRFYKDNYLIPIIAVFLATIGYGALFLLLSRLAGLYLPFWSSLIFFVFPQAVYNAVLAPLFYLPVFIFFLRQTAEGERLEKDLL
ncbi:MAG: rod shape-determining protein MreD [Clostridia bacterium]|nr:rod shape-determining protein MreD [Clostridia bacterium]